MKNYLRLFFGKFFLLGLILILISCIIDLGFEKYFIVQIIENCISTVGVALMIGSIFDFSKNSEEFTQFMSNIVKKIIITKDFLGELTNEEKKNMLESVVSPANSQLEQYSSINHYYKKSIESFIDLYNKSFKTNLSIHLIAKMEDDVVVCIGSVSYRRYKVGDNYSPIETNFEKENSTIENSYILLPDGSRQDLKENYDIDVKDKNELSVEKIGKRYMTNIPEKLKDYPYITLCKNIKEIGYDHWTVFNWSSLTPCDGISFELHCTDGLIIKEYKVFDNPKLYEINLNEEQDKIDIISTSWLNEYTGFTLTISKK